jgi:hypothetical protein
LHPGEVSGVRLESVYRGLRELVRELDCGQSDVGADVKDGANIEVGKPQSNVASKIMTDTANAVAPEIADGSAGCVTKVTYGLHGLTLLLMQC